MAPRKLSQPTVDSDDDSSKATSPEPRPKATGKNEAKKSKKRPVESDSQDSDADEKPKATSKKGKKASATTEEKEGGDDDDEDRGEAVEALENDDGDTYVSLGANKRATVRKFKGAVLVDIRETYEKDGKTGLPGKKGISLNLAQFDQLRKSINVLSNAVKELA
ncbi:hypothetical protein JCM10212_000438 [Sporobolomyces blumeae]